MLDFDKATQFELNEHDVNQKLLPAFLGNDPYFPRKNVDEDLWEKFSAVYQRAGVLILSKIRKVPDKSTWDLPKMLILELEKRMEELARWDPEAEIEFGY
jgi:Zinc finger protein